MSRRYFEFDFIRAIAIVAVLMIHVAGFFPWFNSSFSWHGYYAYYQVTSFAVPVFVMMAGGLAAMGAEARRIKYFEFISQKIKFIFIPYLVWSFVYILLAHRDKSAADIVGLVLFGKSSFHLYFVVIILQLFILFPVFLFAAKKLPMESLFASLVVQWGVSRFFDNFFPSMANAFGASFFSHWVFVFYVGCWAGINYSWVSGFVERYFSAIIGILAAFSIYKIGDYYWVVNIAEKSKFYGYGQTTTVQNAIYSIIVIMFLWGLSGRVSREVYRFAACFVARHAFGVYLLHMVFIAWIKDFYSVFGVRSSGAAVLLALVITMGLSLISTAAIGRLPIGRFLVGGR